jgi:hypothetical protein
MDDNLGQQYLTCSTGNIKEQAQVDTAWSHPVRPDEQLWALCMFLWQRTPETRMAEELKLIYIKSS